jgi:hypothetical protein
MEKYNQKSFLTLPSWNSSVTGVVNHIKALKR